jgi:two-component sensor histidine kinase
MLTPQSQIGLIANELLTNAFKYAFAGKQDIQMG